MKNKQKEFPSNLIIHFVTCKNCNCPSTILVYPTIVFDICPYCNKKIPIPNGDKN